MDSSSVSISQNTMPEIIVLISAFKEDQLLASCIDSAKDVGPIIVFDGPVNIEENRSQFISRILTGKQTSYGYYKGWWKSDADKRTDMLKEAQAINEDAWALWLDGDEILLYGEYLKDHVQRAEQETATGGTTIRIVEYDGSVAQCYGKLIRLAAVDHYVMSSYEIVLKTGLTVALPNVPICSMGGLPLGPIENRDDPILALQRPPLMGEPHLLHRHGLRDPNRTAPRLHDEEAKDFQLLLEGENSGKGTS